MPEKALLVAVAICALSTTSFCDDEFQEMMRRNQHEIEESRERLRDARNEYQDGMLELNRDKIEWKLEALAEPDEAPGPEERELRTKLMQSEEASLRRRVVQSDLRLKYHEAKARSMRLEYSMQSIHRSMQLLQQEGIETDALRTTLKSIEVKLHHARILQEYFGALLDGNEQKVRHLTELLGEHVPPPLKLEKFKEL